MSAQIDKKLQIVLALTVFVGLVGAVRLMGGEDAPTESGFDAPSDMPIVVATTTTVTPIPIGDLPTDRNPFEQLVTQSSGGEGAPQTIVVGDGALGTEETATTFSSNDSTTTAPSTTTTPTTLGESPPAFPLPELEDQSGLPTPDTDPGADRSFNG